MALAHYHLQYAAGNKGVLINDRVKLQTSMRDLISFPSHSPITRVIDGRVRGLYLELIYFRIKHGFSTISPQSAPKFLGYHQERRDEPFSMVECGFTKGSEVPTYLLGTYLRLYHPLHHNHNLKHTTPITLSLPFFLSPSSQN